jgi:hypothetical protein
MNKGRRVIVHDEKEENICIIGNEQREVSYC